MSEQDQVDFGASRIDYTVLRSGRRRKTVEITLDPAQGVLVAAPLDTPAERLQAIVLKRARWIIRQERGDRPRLPPRLFVSGESLPYLGRQVRLKVEPAAVKRPSLTFRHWSFDLVVPAGLDGETRQAALTRVTRRWYEQRAVERLPRRLRRLAVLVGQAPTGVLVRDQRQRWASCSPAGVLRFNWRLMMAPPVLIDYVLLHELVHLGIRGHSAEFWTEVRRARLKEIGPYLAI